MSKLNSSHSKSCFGCSSCAEIDHDRRRFLRTGMQILGWASAACALIPFVSSLKPNRRVLAANGPMEIDISHLQAGQQMTVVWRGKPIWIIRRTPEMLAQLKQPNPALRDPNSLVAQQPLYAQNIWRSIQPEYLVLVGVCTHLGCTPQYKTHNTMFLNNAAGFYCPCHGSQYDLAGRVYLDMPAPINLEVPPYHFKGVDKIVIGESL